MKRFLKNIIFFLSLPIAGLTLLFFAEYDKAFAWNFIEGDCGGHGSWMYDRIYRNSKPIDVAFVGSSHIISALNDEQIETAFQSKGFDLHFANLGYCRLGRNMSYLLTKVLLEEKQTKYIILEIRNDEDRYSHPMFPYLADSEGVWKPVLLFNRDIFSDIYLAVIARIEFWKDRLFYKNPIPEPDLQAYGHASSAAIVQPDILEEKRAGRIKIANQSIGKISRDFYMRYPRKYLQRLGNLCRRTEVTLIFLYTPSFGYIDFVPKELETYQQYGEIWIPPPEIFNNKTYWADDVHLNTLGGKACSSWFINKFEELLPKK